MIIFGCIARNTFGYPTKPFPDNWASIIRSICMAFVLSRGGLLVQFSGKLTILLILTTVPQTIEATVYAWVGKALFGMPTIICYCLAYSLACVGHAVLSPGCMSLNAQGYGKKKGIPNILIAAGTFDIIICVIINGIVTNIALIGVGGGEAGKSSTYQIGMIFV